MTIARFSRNALRSISLGMMSLLPAIVIPAVVVRHLEPANATAWLYALSVATYIAHFHLGVGPAASTLVARYQTSQRTQVALLSAGTIVLLAAAASALLLLLVLNQAGLFNSPITQAISANEWTFMFTLAIAGSAALLLLQGFTGYAQGLFEVGRLLPLNALRHLSIALFCSLAAVWVGTAQAVAVAYAIAAGTTVLLAIKLVWAEIMHHGPIASALVRAQLRPLLTVSIPAALSGFAQIPLIGLHVVLVAKFAPQAMVAFSITLSVLGLVSGLIWAVLGNLLPELSERYANDPADRHRSGAIVTRGTPMLGLALIVIATGLTLVLPTVLRIIATEQHASGIAGAVCSYAAVMIVRELNLPKNLALLAIGRQNVSLLPVYLEAVTGLSLAVFLMPEYGLPGLTAAVLISLLISSTVHLIVLVRSGCLAPSDRLPLITATYSALILIAAFAWIAFHLARYSPSIGAMAGQIATLSAASLCVLGLYWWLAVPASTRLQISAAIIGLTRTGSFVQPGKH